MTHDVCSSSCGLVGKQGRQSINHMPNDNMPLNGSYLCIYELFTLKEERLLMYFTSYNGL